MLGQLKNCFLVLTAAVATAGLGAAMTSAAPVFEDHMDNLNNWTIVHGGSASMALATADVTAPNAPYMTLNNTTTVADLGTMLTSWSLTLTVRQTHDSRTERFGIFDSAGENGYLGEWNSSNGGTGFVRLRKYASTTPYDWHDDSQFDASVYYPQSLKVDGKDFATFNIAWDAGKHTLTLSVNGTRVQQIIDADPIKAQFSKIYLIGNGNGSGDWGEFDDVAVSSTPEPGSLGALGVGGLLLLRRRRSK